MAFGKGDASLRPRAGSWAGGIFRSGGAARLTVAQASQLESQVKTVKSPRRKTCDIIRWSPDEDGKFTETAAKAKLTKLGYNNFSEVLRLNGLPGERFPFHAHGDSSLECQIEGSTRFHFPNQDPVDIFKGDIVDCPKGKDGAHSVEFLTAEQGVLVANKEVVFDDMIIALFDAKGMGKENYSETINGAILEDRVRASLGT